MIPIILLAFVVLSLIGFVVAVIKGFARKALTAIAMVVITCGYLYTSINDINSPGDFVKHIFDKVTLKKNENLTDTSSDTSYETGTYLVERLTGNETSSTSEGAVKYGATFIMGELDKGRSTWAHILVTDAQEPGSNGESRPGKITVDPKGWRNYKLSNGSYAFDRTHLVGYQFSGINSDLRDLTIGTAYLNRGTEGRGSDESNVEGMLYYEQQLDSWLANHPNYALDLYVEARYEGDNVTPHEIYMQWVGVDENDQTIPINIGGLSQRYNDGTNSEHHNYYSVTLKNESPSFEVHYDTNVVTITEKGLN